MNEMMGGKNKKFRNNRTYKGKVFFEKINIKPKIRDKYNRTYIELISDTFILALTRIPKSINTSLRWNKIGDITGTLPRATKTIIFGLSTFSESSKPKWYIANNKKINNESIG